MNSAFCVAVHALVYLNHKNCSLSSEELAENICTNPARVRKIMSLLKRADLVWTKTGMEGGYRFIGDPESVTLDRIADALGIRFVETGWKSGSSEMECLVASGMAGIMDEIFSDLDQECRNRLQKLSIADLDRKIFGDKNNDVRRKDAEREACDEAL